MSWLHRTMTLFLVCSHLIVDHPPVLKKKQLTENPLFLDPAKAPTSFGSSSPSTVNGRKSGSQSKSIPALMKMIELWNPVLKGSTSSPTKKSWPANKWVGAWVSGKAVCAQLSFRGQFEEEGKRSMVLAFDKGVSARKEGIRRSDNSSWRSPVTERKSQIRRKYRLHGQSVSQP